MSMIYKIFLYWIVAITITSQLLITPIEASNFRSYDWWWIFYERDNTLLPKTMVFRPLYLSSVENERNAFYASLLPFVWWAYETPREYRWKSLFGLVQSVNYMHASGVQDYDFGLFPFIFYGTSVEDRDRYLLIWPFGGTLKGKLGQDEITTYFFPGFLLFFLFPPTFPPTILTTAIFISSFIPLYVEYTSRDYNAWGILWPIVQRGRSQVRNDFRILPFYAHNYKQNSYDNYSFFLIINYNKIFLKDDEQHTFFLLPFFGRRWNLSGKVESATLLWPFFSWGYNHGTGSFVLNFPWPFVQIHDSQRPRLYKRIFFPLYGIYQFEEQESFFITPLYFSLRTEKKNFRSRYHFISIVFWYFTREYLDKPSTRYGNRWKYIKLWPLFQFESDDRGNISFNMLSLLPWRDPEGYEMLYQPFWTLFEYRQFQNGERRMGFLLRLYYQRWNENYFCMKIPFLLSYEIENGRVREISFLLSMFSYHCSVEGIQYRFFWIPFGNRTSEKKKTHISNFDGSNIDYNEIALLPLNQRWNYNAFDFDKLFCPGQCSVSQRIF